LENASPAPTKKGEQNRKFNLGQNFKTEKRLKEKGRKKAGKIYATNIFNCIV
jgi:hypothetical protein